jgi:ABC-type uncharacterized transport system involved in gliding motility auxiliary subunit
LRLQNLGFILLLAAAVAMTAWLSTRYVVQADWTSGARNSLSAESRELLTRLPEPMRITAFVRQNVLLRKAIETLVGRYQRYKPDITLDVINPDATPERARELGITGEGELYIEYAGLGQRVLELNEQAMTNALLRLGRSGERVVTFLSGHGERKPLGEANHDLGNFGRELERTGITLREHTLASETRIPDDTSLLVIAGPQTELFPGEVELIEDYLNRGGNLLWMAEPDHSAEVTTLGEALGVRFLEGVIVDADTPLFGIDNPTFILVAEYGRHPITADVHAVTVFPTAAALDVNPTDAWEPIELLTTQTRTWTETGPISGQIGYDAESNERAGPLTLAVALTRPRPGTAVESEDPELPQQRVIVTGDGDFLANAYLGNGANLALGLNLFNWLSQDDALISIRAKSAPDQTLDLSANTLILIGVGHLLVLPAALVSLGLLVWIRRRRR